MSGLPARHYVDLGMFGESAECLLVDGHGFGGKTQEGVISSKAAALAELHLFINAKGWEAKS